MLEKSKRIFKRFISNRCFPLVVACAALLAVLVVAFLLGFRITYAPELKNSWDAISGVAAWVGIAVSIASAVASFMAVWYAVHVADKQNQIALFEKKYEILEIVVNCSVFSDILKDAKSDLDVRTMFLVTIGSRSLENKKSADCTLVSAIHLTVIRKLKQIPFLFGNIDGLNQLPELINTLTNLVIYCCQEKKTSNLHDKIQGFSEYINSIDYKKLIDAMQNQLILK